MAAHLGPADPITESTAAQGVTHATHPRSEDSAQPRAGCARVVRGVPMDTRGGDAPSTAATADARYTGTAQPQLHMHPSCHSATRAHSLHTRACGAQTCSAHVPCGGRARVCADARAALARDRHPRAQRHPACSRPCQRGAHHAHASTCDSARQRADCVCEQNRGQRSTSAHETHACPRGRADTHATCAHSFALCGRSSAVTLHTVCPAAAETARSRTLAAHVW